LDLGDGTTPTTYTLSAPPGVTTVISDKVSNAIDGILYNDAGTNTFADGDTIYIWWIAIFGAFDTVAGDGVRARFAGATSTDYFEVTVGGSDSGKSGWQLTAINIGKARGNPSGQGGTPPTAANIQRIGIVWDVTAGVSGNNDNVAIGNIYRQASTSRSVRVDGTTETWATIAADSLTAGDGLFISDTNGAIRANGSIAFGPASGSADFTFEDTGIVIAFEDHTFLENDFYQLEMDLPVSYTGTARITAGTKTGTGASATGANGWSIVTGGPKWRLVMEDTDQDDVQFYGCAFQNAGDFSLDDPAVEMIGNSIVDSGTVEITGNATAASMPRWIGNSFSMCPGPRAQVVWTNETSPSIDGFNGNLFTGMSWFALEIGQGMTGNFSFEARDNEFSGNGTNRDILASNDIGTLTFNTNQSPAPTGTNGTTINITLVGTVDCFAYTVNTYEDVSDTDGAQDQSAQGVPLVTQSTASLSADADTFAVSGAAPFGALTYTGVSDQYTDDILFEDISGGLVIRVGLDEVTPGSGTRTGFPVHDGTETEGVQAILHVNEFAASTPVALIDPGHRPWALVENGSTATFGYGAAINGTHANTKCFVTVIALDDTTAANTAVSTITIDTGASTQALTSRINQQDDNTGAAGSSLELSIYDLHEAVDTTEQGAGLTIVANPVATTVHVEDNLGVDLQNVRVAMWAADGTGIYPFEEVVTITTASTTATVDHTGHGMATGDFAVIRGANEPELNSIHEITFIDVDTYTYTITSIGGASGTGTITATGGMLSGLTNVNGDISRSRVVSTNTPIAGYVRLSTTSVRYKSFSLAGNTIDSGSGLTVNIRMVPDE
jgi:hypothetical protein